MDTIDWRDDALPWEPKPPLSGKWSVRLGWREVAGRMECVGVSLEPQDAREPAQRVTATLVHAVPIGEFIAKGARIRAGSAAIVDGAYVERGELDAAQKPRGRGRVLGDDHYRNVARVYAAAWCNGEAPTQAVQWHPDFAPVAHSTAARWVQECRKRGFLEQTDERSFGGVPAHLQHRARGGLPRWIDREQEEDK